MYPLLTFEGAEPRSPAVSAWFKSRPSELSALAEGWFRILKACGPDVLELLHDGCPVACVRDAPFGYVNVFRAHVNVGFFHGASLPDPSGLLVGEGKYMRHVKLKPGVSADQAALEQLISAAYQDIQVRWRHHAGPR